MLVAGDFESSSLEVGSTTLSNQDTDGGYPHTTDVWLGQLTRQSESPLLRMKGILAVPGDPRRFVFNGVRSVVDVRPDRPWGEETRFSRIVMIGRKLDYEILQAGFTACSATSV